MVRQRAPGCESRPAFAACSGVSSGITLAFLSFILQIAGALGVFLFGLKAMSEGLQRAAGGRLRRSLRMATSKPLLATLSGFLLTAIIQSSSATTVMVVAVCSAGLMSLGQSLGVILGANIGTTTTGWVVSWIGFRVHLTAVAAPLVGIGFFSQYFEQWKGLRRFGQVMVGLGFLLLGLDLLRDAMPQIEDVPTLDAWMDQLDPSTYPGLMLCVLFGTAMTAVLQSSSASMAVTLTAAAKGYIDFPTCAAIALGQNIGTTLTALLAAISASLDARRAALGHVLFNVVGALWVGLLLGPAVRFVDWLIPGEVLLRGAGDPTLVATHTAAFHSVFNVANACLFLLGRRQFERVLVRLLPERGDDRADHRELVYLATPFGEAPDLLLSAARRELQDMAGTLITMVEGLKRMLATEHSAEMPPPTLEEMSRLRVSATTRERKIGDYLAQVVHGQLSVQAGREALGLLNVVHGLSRTAGHAIKVARLIERLAEEHLELSDMACVELIQMAEAVAANLREMHTLLLEPSPRALDDVARREDELNRLRDRFRASHLERVRDGLCQPQVGLVFMEMLGSFEKMGDQIYTVAMTASAEH